MEPVDIVEVEAAEDLGFFFKRLGEICFSPASSQSFPGPASSLAVAAQCGAVFFSDVRGMLSKIVWEISERVLGGCGARRGHLITSLLLLPCLCRRSLRLQNCRHHSKASKMEQRRVSCSCAGNGDSCCAAAAASGQLPLAELPIPLLLPCMCSNHKETNLNRSGSTHTVFVHLLQ